MRRTKKWLKSCLIVCLLFSTLTGVAVAAPSDSAANYSEEKLNQILRKAGTPDDVIATMEFELKKRVVSESGKNLEFGSMTETEFYRDEATGNLIKAPESTGSISPLASIPRTDLIFRIYDFAAYIGSTKYVDVYGGFEWLQSGNGPESGPAGVNKDIVAITIPDGWEIQAGNYSCDLYYSQYFGGIGWSSWTHNGTSGCGSNSGNPHSSGYSLYGAAWQLGGDARSDLNFVVWKGSVKLRMKKVNSSAINRVIVEYMEAKNNIFGNWTFGLAWSALSVSYTGSAGSVNEANADHTLTSY